MLRRRQRRLGVRAAVRAAVRAVVRAAARVAWVTRHAVVYSIQQRPLLRQRCHDVNLAVDELRRIQLEQQFHGWRGYDDANSDANTDYFRCCCAPKHGSFVRVRCQPTEIQRSGSLGRKQQLEFRLL